ncbi:hypothetical protein D3C72_1977750 [compost metagenome]
MLQLRLQGAAIPQPGHGIEQGEATVLQIDANEGKHQDAPRHQQDQLPDLQPEQALADLVDRGLPLLAGEDLIADLLHLVGQLGNPGLRAIQRGPLL